MERRKIARACFVGGFVCALLATAIMPKLWWFGLMAGVAGGFVSGYLAYEFKKVLQAIPVAWRKSYRDRSRAWAEIKKWFGEPHPFLLTSILVFIPAAWLALQTHKSQTMPVAIFYMISFTGCFCIIALWNLFLIFFVFVGAEQVEKVFFVVPNETEDEKMEYREEKYLRGLTKKPFTYGNFFRWAAKGLVWTIFLVLKLLLLMLHFLFWRIWYLAISFSVRFARNLFRFIHCKRRLLCAIDGTLGGIAAVFWFGPQAGSLMSCVFVAICGGLIGAAIGVLDYELISMPLPKSEPQKA